MYTRKYTKLLNIRYKRLNPPLGRHQLQQNPLHLPAKCLQLAGSKAKGLDPAAPCLLAAERDSKGHREAERLGRLHGGKCQWLICTKGLKRVSAGVF